MASWAAVRATARAAVLRVTWGTTMGASVGGLVAFGGLNGSSFVWTAAPPSGQQPPPLGPLWELTSLHTRKRPPKSGGQSARGANSEWRTAMVRQNRM